MKKKIPGALLLLIAGMAALSAGCYILSPAAGLICAGVLLIATAVLSILGGDHNDDKH